MMGFRTVATAWMMIAYATATTSGEAPPGNGTEFHLHFTNRSEVLTLFEEGSGVLTTDGSLSCQRKDHILYNQTMGGAYDKSIRGLQLRMDNQNAGCVNGSEISTGHLRGYDYYSWGDFIFTLRGPHSPDGLDAPSNAMACFGLYVDGPPHNEMTVCWHSWKPSDISFGYWTGLGDGKETRWDYFGIKDVGRAYHTYRIIWRPTYVAFKIDDSLVVRGKGNSTVNGTLPWRPLSIRLILRPRFRASSHYIGDAHLNIPYLAYIPWDAIISQEEEDEEEEGEGEKEEDDIFKEHTSHKTEVQRR